MPRLLTLLLTNTHDADAMFIFVPQSGQIIELHLVVNLDIYVKNRD